MSVRSLTRRMHACVHACCACRYELLWRAFRQNFVFLLSLIVGGILGCCLVYACCRFCAFCPLYQRKLHQTRMKSMEIGQRA